MDKAKLESPFAGSVRYIFRGIHIFLGGLGQESKAYLCCLTNHYLYLYCLGKEDQQSQLSIEPSGCPHSFYFIPWLHFGVFQPALFKTNVEWRICNLDSRRECSMTLDLEALPWFVLNDRNTTEWIFPRHGNVFKRQERLLGNSLALCPYGMLENLVQVQFVYMQIWSSPSITSLYCPSLWQVHQEIKDISQNSRFGCGNNLIPCKNNRPSIKSIDLPFLNKWNIPDFWVSPNQLLLIFILKQGNLPSFISIWAFPYIFSSLTCWGWEWQSRFGGYLVSSSGSTIKQRNHNHRVKHEEEGEGKRKKAKREGKGEVENEMDLFERW